MMMEMKGPKTTMILLSSLDPLFSYFGWWRRLGFSSPHGPFMKVACKDEEGLWVLQTSAHGRMERRLSLWCAC